jgi:hypothetical protein
LHSRRVLRAGSLLRCAIGSDWKGKLPPVLYTAAIVMAFQAHWIAQAIY